jgi:hypothetical protein
MQPSFWCFKAIARYRGAWLALVALVLLALPAGATVVYHTSYTPTLDVCGNSGYGGCAPDFSTPSVYDVMLLEDGSMTWAFGANPEGTSTIANPFPYSSPPAHTLILGLVSNLPGDDTLNTPHMLLFMDPTGAGLASGADWNTLFPNTSESALIANLELATSGQDWSIVTPGLDFISNFAVTDAASSWFSTGGNFSAVTFSNGVLVGSGTSTITAEGTVPEPSGALTLALALGLLWWLRRHRAPGGISSRRA